MGDSIEQRRGHLGVAEDLNPFAKVEVCRDDQAGLFIQLAHEMEQERSAGFREGHVTQLIQNHDINLREPSCHLAWVISGLLLDQQIHQVNDVKESNALA